MHMQTHARNETRKKRSRHARLRLRNFGRIRVLLAEYTRNRHPRSIVQIILIMHGSADREI
jgi:hypothetical protein